MKRARFSIAQAPVVGSITKASLRCTKKIAVRQLIAISIEKKRVL
jgi:hypothetical protein